MEQVREEARARSQFSGKRVEAWSLSDARIRTSCELGLRANGESAIDSRLWEVGWITRFFICVSSVELWVTLLLFFVSYAVITSDIHLSGRLGLRQSNAAFPFSLSGLSSFLRRKLLAMPWSRSYYDHILPSLLPCPAF